MLIDVSSSRRLPKTLAELAPPLLIEAPLRPHYPLGTRRTYRNNPVILRTSLTSFEAVNDLAGVARGTCAKSLIIPCACHAVFT
jgi:hypothetical protein